MTSRRLIWTLSICAAFALPIAATAPAAASPGSTTADGQSAHGPATAAHARAHVSGTRATDRAAVRAATAAYWTPQRMAHAISADRLASDHGSATHQPHATGPAHSVLPAAPTAKPAAAPARAHSTQPDLAVNASPTVGKVFFHNPGDGNDYVCSGSAVNSAAKNLVSTAGHCVYDPDHSNWMQNWQFVPYYDHGDRPYGTFYAAQLTTFQGWTDDGDYDWDVGFVNVWANDNELVDTVGGNGIDFNFAKDLYITVIAYPAEDPYDGEWQYACQNNIYPYGDEQVGFDCLITGGASGGPFLNEYDESSLLGYVDGIVSHGPDEISYSPYFDTDVQNLFNGVASYTP